jgi:predicted transcriptional regulator
MRAKEEYRDREDVQVAVLDALAERSDEGMTLFEVRTHVETDIDAIEQALSALKTDGLIEVETEDGRTVFLPEDTVVTAEEPDDDGSVFDAIRDRFSL